MKGTWHDENRSEEPGSSSGRDCWLFSNILGKCMNYALSSVNWVRLGCLILVVQSDLVWFGLVYGISTIKGYLIPIPLYTYILNIQDLACLGFMAYQPLQVI